MFVRGRVGDARQAQGTRHVHSELEATQNAAPSFSWPVNTEHQPLTTDYEYLTTVLPHTCDIGPASASTMRELGQ